MAFASGILRGCFLGKTPHSHRHRLYGVAAMFVVASWMFSTSARAHPSEGDEKPAPAENILLKTTDSVTLAATFYPSKRGKDAAAVILLHDDGGKRAELDRLARRLQLLGAAVIVPDLRGHGESTTDQKQLRHEDYEAMVAKDLEAVKGFLLKRNNEGELNIERLGIVGVHLGAALALNWAALDWSWPELAIGKQGQDVKALALISPEWSYKGVRIGEAVVEPDIQTELSIFIVVGSRNGKFHSEARRLYNNFAKHHDVSRSQPIERQTLFLQEPPTTLQGQQLLSEPSIEVEAMVAEFIELRLIDPPYTWQMRKPPL
jgi:pimeloyl-ACP methyl ester carboxylesterase